MGTTPDCPVWVFEDCAELDGCGFGVVCSCCDAWEFEDWLPVVEVLLLDGSTEEGVEVSPCSLFVWEEVGLSAELPLTFDLLSLPSWGFDSFNSCTLDGTTSFFSWNFEKRTPQIASIAIATHAMIPHISLLRPLPLWVVPCSLRNVAEVSAPPSTDVDSEGSCKPTLVLSSSSFSTSSDSDKLVLSSTPVASSVVSDSSNSGLTTSSSSSISCGTVGATGNGSSSISDSGWTSRIWIKCAEWLSWLFLETLISISRFSSSVTSFANIKQRLSSLVCSNIPSEHI